MFEHVNEIVPGVRLESRPCPLCSTETTEAVFTGFDRLHGLPGSFTIVRCTECGLMRTNPRPTPDTIGFYYPDEYGPYQYTRVETPVPAPAANRWKQSLRRLMDPRSALLPRLEPGRMLEVGCASGGFLAHMQRAGWSVRGIEFSTTAAQLARDAGFDVFAGSIDDADLPQSEYDLIVAWMVLEHLHDPVAALKQLRRAVKSSGSLVFSVPNAASIDFRLFRDAGYAVQLPTHLFHFTPRTLRAILDEAGWKLNRIIHQRTLANLVASLGYRLSEHFPNSHLARKLVAFPETGGRIQDMLFPAAYLLSLCGQTGRMTVWASPA